MGLPNIQDDGMEGIRGELSISKIEEKESNLEVDSGLSTIEKSKFVTPEVIPAMNTPLLVAPTDQDSLSFAILSVDATGHFIIDSLKSIVLMEDPIKNSVVKQWIENLREIEEQVRQLLNFPIYQQLQEIRQKGDPRLGAISGAMGPSAANAAAKLNTEHLAFLSALDRFQVLERIPPTAEIKDPFVPQDSSRTLVLPLAAAVLVGAGLSIGGMEISNSLNINTLDNIIEMVERIQPLFPQLTLQELIPMINLMLVAPIYFHSWDAAVNNLHHREQYQHIQMVQNFAKDVIKMVRDPTFVTLLLVNQLKDLDQLSPNEQDRLNRMLKIILIGVALSLLYSIQVGKVQNHQFGGLPAEELRDLLIQEQNIFSNQAPNTHQELIFSLINHIHQQLATLSREDRVETISMLLDYVDHSRLLNHMLDPFKVFNEVLKASTYNRLEKIDPIKI